MSVETVQTGSFSWPEQWQRVSLADAGRWMSGGTPSTSNGAYWDGDIPWISGASLKQFRITDSERRVTRLGAENGSRLVDKGAVLFIVRGMSLKSEFRIGVTQREVAFGQDCKALVPDENIDPFYLAYAMRVLTPTILSMVEETSHGTGRLDTNRLNALEIGVPPLPEQRDIVAAHEAFERRVGALERELAKLATLRRGIVDEQATGPDARLGDLLTESPKNGYSASEVHEWTGMLVLGLGCLTNDGFVPRQLKRIPKSPLAERFRLADGDLLMSRANTRELVGLAARFRDVGQPCSYPDLMMRLRPDEGRCLTAYLELVLGSSRVRRDVQAGARGTSESMVKIGAGTVESLSIPLPTIAEQQKAVDAVTSVDRRSATVRVLLDKLRVTQRAVVEDLLSGRSRVNRT
ncbi:restriction endonuclease subunit S [Streptomyces sp. NPDC059701]|uniref:restriction endonuclease subunit S n=1 Tax=Streptomyces sp. NPDC059701 TaxID=3346914 RepID=UPI003688F448